jgi:putative intracellular protease/amidase
MSSVLFILTGATSWTQKDGSQRASGFWGEEFVVPHQIFSSAGVSITIATPEGSPAVVDGLSISPEANHGDTAKVAAISAYLNQHGSALRTPARVADLDVEQFDAVFVPGGHGPMQDLAVHGGVGKILAEALNNPAKVVAAVCHGQASFLAAGDAASWAFKGRKLTAFSNAEEAQVGLADNAPWLLEDRLRAAGAAYEAGTSWTPNVVIDGNLVTGQNPASAEAAAKAVIELLSQRVTAR